jgi:small subunit ribosomal protein S16
MLAIRLQRTGRKGHAMFRMVVQDSRRTPTSGRFVAQLGSYDPHSKTLVIDKEKAAQYLKNGARPSDRVAHLLKEDGVKLPSWVVLESNKKGALRNAEKLRKNQPKEEKTEEVVAEAEAEPEAETPVETEEKA